MANPLEMACAILAAVGVLLFLENRAVRSDQAEMQYAYGSFLASKAGGKPLSSLIKPKTLAVLKSSEGMVACAVLKGG